MGHVLRGAGLALLATVLAAGLRCAPAAKDGGPPAPAPPPAAPGPTTPQAPTGLVAAPVSTSQVSLAWTDYATNESQFQIERSATGNSFATIAATAANVTTYTDAGLSTGSTYW